MTSEIDQILSQLPLDQIGAQVCATPEAVKQAAYTVVPALLSALGANAADPAKASALLGALDEHAERDPATVDTAEAEKIAAHILGPDQDAALSQFSGHQFAGGTAGTLTKKLIPILAPIVLSYLAKRVGGKGAGALGAVLGTILAGAASGTGTSTKTSSTGSIFSKILQSILGRK